MCIVSAIALFSLCDEHYCYYLILLNVFKTIHEYVIIIIPTQFVAFIATPVATSYLLTLIHRLLV